MVELVSAGHALCGAVIADARPVEIDGEDLTVGFPTTAAFLKKKAEDPNNRRIVRGALRELTGTSWRVSYELREDLDSDDDGRPSGGYSEEEWVRALQGGAGRRRDPRRARASAGRREGTVIAMAKGQKQPRMGDMQQVMRQAQKMQQDMLAAQEQLKSETVQASAGGGMVTVTVTGDLEVKAVVIDPAAVDPEDVDILADMVLAAVNEALRAAQELAASKMGATTAGLDLGALGGLGLPGL